MNEKIKKIINIIVIFLLLFMIFWLVDDIIGKSIFEDTVYNSYELQARAWLSGQTFLDHDYSYLELAIYNGKYFVSFPPFPSVFLLPFALIFPNNIPANFISFILFSIEFVIIYKILRKYKTSELNSILLSAGFTLGSNLFSLSIDSGVWFIAQLLNNFLCILSIDSFLKKRKTMSYLFLALAVGCRPFSVIYIFMYFVYYMIVETNEKIFRRFLKNIVPLIPTVIIGILYMIYNYIRFDSIFEFGHNYLPEFVNSDYGQFHIHYLLDNLKGLFFNGVSIKSNMHISFCMPFSFLFANPIFLVYYYRCFKNIKNKVKISRLRLLILIFTIFNIIFICLHKTLGGFQFGSRYTCDILPFIFLAIIWKKNSKNQIESVKLNTFEIVCIVFGIILNIFGALMMYLDKLS